MYFCIAFGLLAVLPLRSLVSAHGYMTTPRTRNTVANEDGLNWGSRPGVPSRETCPHCLNSKGANEQCGTSTGGANYSTWLDSLGRPMPWKSQEIYTEGQEITVEVTLTANHGGHIDLFVCPNVNNPTRACFESNPVTFVRDELHGGPVDPHYPERAYIAWPNEINPVNFKFAYKLPRGVVGDKVLMQWRYVTANSCIPAGYRDSPIFDFLREKRWNMKWGMGDCGPLNDTGAGVPEQFWNCAEITIKSDGSPPTPTETPPTPTVIPPTPARPSPTAEIGTCGNGERGNGICADTTLCCSKWGWCGKTIGHCGEPTPTPPPLPHPTPTGSPPGHGTCGGGNVGNGYCNDTDLCCSQWGHCGSSPAHCKDVCGGGKRGNGKCRDPGKCCSAWGWCGNTHGHCGRRGLRSSKSEAK